MAAPSPMRSLSLVGLAISTIVAGLVLFSPALLDVNLPWWKNSLGVLILAFCIFQLFVLSFRLLKLITVSGIVIVVALVVGSEVFPELINQKVVFHTIRTGSNTAASFFSRLSVTPTEASAEEPE